MKNNSRAHYRIVYGRGIEPILECAQGKYSVMDISESGIRFLVAHEAIPRFAEGAVVEGKIHFPEKRGFVAIKGVVLRSGPREVALSLQQGGQIPLAKIMEEQRVLIQKGRLPKSS